VQLYRILIGVKYTEVLINSGIMLPENNFKFGCLMSSFSKTLEEFISLLPGQLGYIGIAFCIMGILQFIKRNLTLCIFTTLLFLGCTFYAFNYGIHDIEPYFSLAFIALFIFTAVGVAYSISYIQSKSQNSAIQFS
jgi:hypothetical protein